MLYNKSYTIYLALFFQNIVYYIVYHVFNYIIYNIISIYSHPQVESLEIQKKQKTP